MLSGVREIVPFQRPSDSRHRYLIGSFVTHVLRNQPKLFAYLETILKGMMLANVLYLPDTSKSIKKRWTTSFYFDTPFVIEALGYQGSTKRELRLELISALLSTGAKVCCFAHNVDEVSNSLFACGKIIESGNIGKAYGPMVSSIDYILEKGFESF